MRVLPSAALGALTLTCALSLLGNHASAQTQVQRVATTLPSRIGQTKLPKDPIVKDADIGPPSTVSGAALADLLIKDSYIDEYAGMQGVNFLIANTGQQDAGPFEVAITFTYPHSDGPSARWELYPVDGLKVGESKWVSASPLCCGWAGTEVVVNNTSQFTVVVDPKYMKADPLDPYNPARAYEVKPRIVESNKANNKLTINKSDMRKGRYEMTKASERPTPPAIKVQTPIIKH